MSRPLSEDYYPKKIGVQYDPPAIVLEYLIASQSKTKYHKMKINNINLDTQAITRGLRSQHEFYFHNNKLTEANIQKLVEKIKRRRNGGGEVEEQLQGPIPMKKEFSFKDPVQAAEKPFKAPTQESEINYDDDFEDFQQSKLSKISGHSKHEDSYASNKSKGSEAASNGFEFIDEDEAPKPKPKETKKQPVQKPPPIYDPTPIPKSKPKAADFDFQFL